MPDRLRPQWARPLLDGVRQLVCEQPHARFGTRPTIGGAHEHMRPVRECSGRDPIRQIVGGRPGVDTDPAEIGSERPLHRAAQLCRERLTSAQRCTEVTIVDPA
jgi:hypothetical protein